MLIIWKVQGWINPQTACGIAQILYILILNMEPIKLQYIGSVELKNASATSQKKTKLG